MLTALSLLLLGAFLVYRYRDTHPLWRRVWDFIDKTSDLELRALQKRWLIVPALVIGVAALTMVAFHQPWAGVWAVVSFICGVIAFFIAMDWLLVWIERQLGLLVRSEMTRRFSNLVLLIGAVLFLATILYWFGVRPNWIAEASSAFLLFGVGIWSALRALRHSLFDTFPQRDERLASFLIAVLQTILHHAVTAFVLSWGYLSYLTRLVPGILVDPNGSPATFWLLANYTVGKLTVSGSDLVHPAPGIGGVVDTFFSVLGTGFIVFAVTSMFALLQRAKPEED